MHCCDLHLPVKLHVGKPSHGLVWFIRCWNGPFWHHATTAAITMPMEQCAKQLHLYIIHHVTTKVQETETEMAGAPPIFGNCCLAHSKLRTRNFWVSTFKAFSDFLVTICSRILCLADLQKSVHWLGMVGAVNH